LSVCLRDSAVRKLCWRETGFQGNASFAEKLSPLHHGQVMLGHFATFPYCQDPDYVNTCTENEGFRALVGDLDDIWTDGRYP
jgi:hypothetical protein